MFCELPYEMKHYMLAQTWSWCKQKRGMEMDRSYTTSGDWGNSEMAMNSSVKSNCNDPSSSGDTTSEQVHLILVRSSGIILHSCLSKT